MFNLVAYFVLQDTMREQFQTQPLRAEPEAPRLRWRLAFGTWMRRRT